MTFERIDDEDDCDCGKIITRGEIWFLSVSAVAIVALMVMGVFL